jgi:hypothetical protein
MKRILLLVVIIALVFITCASVSVSAQEAMVSGRWEGAVSSAAGSAPITLRIEQEGSQIRGDYDLHGRAGLISEKFTGTIKGNKVEFKNSAYPLRTFIAAIDGDTMNGTFFGGTSGITQSFSASRKK